MNDTLTDHHFFYQRRTPHGVTYEEPITLSTQLILKQAEAKGVAWRALEDTKIIELSFQGKVRHFRFQISPNTTDIGFYACLDKGVTQGLLRSAGVTVPAGYRLFRGDSPDQLKEVFESLTKPLVVKPSHGNQAKGITMGVSTFEQYLSAVEKAFSFLNDKEAGVYVEEQFEGKEYRVVATREKVIGILYRMPGNVVGDGQRTVQQLLDEKNADPRRGTDDTFALFKIQHDEELDQCLRDQEMTLEHVPAAEQRVWLRKTSNISRGGDSIDMTDEAHPSVAQLALKAIQAIPGIDFVGLDFMTTDITQPQTPETHRIIEINSSPGFCINVFPYLGKERHAEIEFLTLAFPELS
jgi:D-alanine-D-alanine ligase-like ATP-grasp enzyme